ncbi:hypothetical protein Tco_0646081 [Tanacetum coccineum]
MYVVRCTRPDFTFAQNLISRFQQNPRKPYWTAMKTILKYLRNIEDMFLVYGGNPKRFDLNKTQGASTPEEVKRMQNVPYASAIGSIMYAVRCTRLDVAFAPNLTSHVHWTGKAPSTVLLQCQLHKLNNIAASEAAMEAVWIRKFILGLGIVPTTNEPIKMFCDNLNALLIANEPRVQRGARHYHRRYHYVRECIELGKINLLKVHTNDNLADPFMKALPKGKLTQHARRMRLRLASSFM